jgi:hypothetical protein
MKYNENEKITEMKEKRSYRKLTSEAEEIQKKIFSEMQYMK